MHGRAVRVAEAISGESRMKKISGNARRNSRCRLFASFPSCHKRQKLKYWASRFCDLAHRSGRTTGKRIVPRRAVVAAVSAAECRITSLLSGKNGATGMSDIHGNAVRVSEHVARG